MSGPAAAFDILVISKKLNESVGNVTGAELYVFAYFACLLALYDGEESAWWQYSFTATETGEPFSSTLEEACNTLIAGGLLIKRNDALQITPQGKAELAILSDFTSYRPRLRYLGAACDTSLAVPLASIGVTLAQEPQLRSAVALMQSRPLIDDAGIALLRPYMEGLRESMDRAGEVGPDRELLVPAVVWLNYLAHEASQRVTDV